MLGASDISAFTPLILLILLVGLPAIWAIAAYNTFIRLKQHCKESWSSIDTELRRRYDLIPNIIEAVKGYAAHEKTVLEEVIAARSKAVASTGSPASQAKDENALVGSLRQLMAVSERYPDLKASANFLQLQEELSNTEDRIQAARRFYNANVRDLNTRIDVFPSNLIARIFSFGKEEFFEIEEARARVAPTVDFR